MKVLLSAYACKPDWGSEPGFGWNWALCLAELGLEVTVLTRGEGREQIETYLKAHPNPHLRFEFLILKNELLRPTGGLHYLFWQMAAVRAAKTLHRKQKFDIVHHVTYGSIHIPTQLWRLGIPTVFGPIGGGQTAPPSLLGYFGSSRRTEEFRTLLTKSLRYSPFHRHWFAKMSTIFAANGDTLDLLKRLGKSDASMEYDVGVPAEYLSPASKTYHRTENPIRLIWVARMLPRKALPMALDVMAQVKQNVSLTVVGSGLPEAVVKEMISSRGLENRVIWAGRRLTMDEVRDAYQEHDAMLFTSVRETCGVQLLEAMAVGLPVITLDLHGARTLIPEGGGIKVPVTTAEEVVARLAEAIDQFAAAGIEKKNSMSKVSWEFAKTCTWASRAAKAQKLYKNLIGIPAPS